MTMEWFKSTRLQLVLSLSINNARISHLNIQDIIGLSSSNINGYKKNILIIK